MKKNNFTGKDFVTKSSKETQKLGYDFAQILENRDVVCLYGDLGGGKTTFTQGMAQGLGIKNRIISPTFIIMRSHKLKTGMFYHVDLYRTGSEKDIEELGVKEIINDSQSIVAIEWAERMGQHLPKNRIDVQFLYEKDDVRKIMFRSPNQ